MTGDALREPAPGLRAPAPLASVLLGLASALAAGLLALGVAQGRPGTTIAVLAVQPAVALCWLALLEAPLLSAALGGAALLVGDAVLLRSRNGHIQSLLAVVGLTVLVGLLQQLARRIRREVTLGLATLVSTVVLGLAPALLLALAHEAPSARAAAEAGLLAAGAAVLVSRLPGLRRAVLSAASGVVVGAAVGAGVGIAHTHLSPLAGALTGAGCGAAAIVVDLAMRRVGAESAAGTGGSLRPLTVLLPVSACVPVAYFAGLQLLR